MSIKMEGEGEGKWGYIYIKLDMAKINNWITLVISSRTSNGRDRYIINTM